MEGLDDGCLKKEVPNHAAVKLSSEAWENGQIRKLRHMLRCIVPTQLAEMPDTVPHKMFPMFSSFWFHTI